MNTCQHPDIAVNAIVRSHFDELSPDVSPQIVLWVGDIKCNVCEKALFISQDAFVDSATGAVGFTLLPARETQQYMRMDGAPVPTLPINEPIVDQSEFEFLDDL